jgi:hypothetical protein
MVDGRNKSIVDSPWTMVEFTYIDNGSLKLKPLTMDYRLWTKIAFPRVALLLLNADKWLFGRGDGFGVQIPFQIIRFS